MSSTEPSSIGLPPPFKPESRRVRAEAERAREATGSVEARFHTCFAEAIVDLSSVVQARRTLAQAAEAEMLDAFVIVYRAYPRLAALLGIDPASVPLVRSVLPAANDGALARRAEIDLAPSRRRLGSRS